MGLLKTPAIVLGSRNLGEADRLVTFFTRAQGKIVATAKGARRIRSRFGGTLEPFTHCQLIVFLKSRDSLPRIQQVDIVRSFRELREELGLIRRASHVTSLTSAMVPFGEANPALYDLVLNALGAISQNGWELAIRLFEIRLIQYSGYQPQFDTEQCLRCRGRLTRPDLFFSPASGGIVCRRCRVQEGTLSQPITSGTAAFFRQAFRMSPKLAGRLRAAPAMKEEIRNLLENYFDHLLDRA